MVSDSSSYCMDDVLFKHKWSFEAIYGPSIRRPGSSSVAGVNKELSKPPANEPRRAAGRSTSAIPCAAISCQTDSTRQMGGVDEPAGSSSRKQEYVPPPVDGDFYRIADVSALTSRRSSGACAPSWKPKSRRSSKNAGCATNSRTTSCPRSPSSNIGGVGYEGYGSAGGSMLLNGFICMEMARVDASIGTFYGVHTGLAAGSIYLCGDEAQKNRWLPPMMRFETIGSFGLTEPEVGSATSGGMMTTCKRDGDHWVLNGQKKWIGNATFSDINVIWARESRPTRPRALSSARTIRASRSRRSKTRWRCAWCRTG